MIDIFGWFKSGAESYESSDDSSENAHLGEDSVCSEIPNHHPIRFDDMREQYRLDLLEGIADELGVEYEKPPWRDGGVYEVTLDDD